MANFQYLEFIESFLDRPRLQAVLKPNDNNDNGNKFSSSAGLMIIPKSSQINVGIFKWHGLRVRVEEFVRLDAIR